jgi:hypothetical protein
MRQRVVLAPRNAGEAVAVAVSAVLLVGSGFAFAHDQIASNATVKASYQAESSDADVRTVSTPGPRVQEFSVNGSRLPHVPVFIPDAPAVLEIVVAGERGSNPRISSPLLGALGEPQVLASPTGGGMADEFPATMPPTSSEAPPTTVEASPTTPPTTPPDPSETTPPTEEPTTPPETESPPPTTEPEPDPDPTPTSDPLPGTDPGTEPGTESGDGAETETPAPEETAPPAEGGGSSEPVPEADGPQATSD